MENKTVLIQITILGVQSGERCWAPSQPQSVIVDCAEDILRSIINPSGIPADASAQDPAKD